LRGTELSALPAMSAATGAALARLLRMYLLVTLLVASIYSAAFFAGGEQLVASLFGRAYSEYHHLVLPIALAHLASAIGLPAYIALRATSRGIALVGIESLGSLLRLILVVAGTLMSGGLGAAWGMAVGGAVYNVGFWAGLVLRAEAASHRPLESVSQHVSEAS